MAQILVRGLDDELVERLKERARRDGRSLQSEVRQILQTAAGVPPLDVAEARRLAQRFRRRFKGRPFPNSAALIREDRDR